MPVQKYPSASLTHWYQGAYPGTPMDVNVVVLHTTEGRTLPGYGGGASAPTLTAVPDFTARRLRWFQHFDIDTSARALVNLPGGVETNTLNVCQVELVGTCDPHTHAAWAGAEHIYWPQAPGWALAELAVFLRWMRDQHGVPLSGPKLWPAYPASYGATTARMTYAQWNAFTGVCGHLHVPESTHGDPGAIDFPKLIALATGTTEENDMALTADDISKVAAATVNHLIAGGGALEDSDLDRVWKRDVIPAATPPYNNPDYFAADQTTIANTTWTATYAQYTQVMAGREILARVKDLQAAAGGVVLTEEQIAVLAAQVAAAPGLTDAIAAKVADLLAARLAE
jgi:hypothetical protein